MPLGKQASQTSDPPPTNPGGAWYLQPDGSLKWMPGAAPDPNVTSKYGLGPGTNPEISPQGQTNYGSWIPANATNAPSPTGGANNGEPNPNPVQNYGDGWIWEWGATPSASQAAQYGYGNLANPNQDPSGGKGVINQPAPKGSASKDPTSIPPPDVTPPNITDTWGGNAPDLTGAVGYFFPSSNQTSGPPPTVQPFKVSPGSIRDQELAIIKTNDAGTSDYTDLVSFISWAKQQNLGDAYTMSQLGDTMDNLAYSYSALIELVGNALSLLNDTAQHYVKAEVSSAFSQFPGVSNVGIPGNYDDASYVIYANPDLMWQLSQFMLSFAKGAGENVNNIVNKWNDLDNSDWMGASASAAQDLMNSVNQAIGTLLGSKQNPQGVFEDTINGIGMASLNYASTEQNNTSNWNSFAAGLATLPAPTAGQQGAAKDVGPTVQTPGDDPDNPFSGVTPT
jgi:hypothetical protein